MPANAPQIAHSIIKHKGGVAKNNRYRVVLPNMFIGGDMITMDVLCRSVNIPGRIITAAERRTGMKIHEMPTGYTTEDLNMSFTETADQSVAKYFDIWTSQIINPETHEIAFKEDIARSILVMPTTDEGIPTRIYKFINTFPKLRPAITYSDSSEAVALQVEVSFSIDDFEVVDAPILGYVNDAVRTIKSGSLTFPSNTVGKFTERFGTF